MQIGGFLPFTASDYPGKLAAILFTQGCNLRCPFCHNAGLLSRKEPSPLALEEIYSQLEQRRGFLDGVVISGGEPTLHDDLPDVLRKIRSYGFVTKLDTNGTSPGVLSRLLSEGLLDFVAMDVKAPISKYHQLSGVNIDTGKILQSMELIASSGLPHQFRTTWVKSLLSEDDLKSVRALLPKGEELTVQTFRPEHALDFSLRQEACV